MIIVAFTAFCFISILLLSFTLSLDIYEKITNTIYGGDVVNACDVGDAGGSNEVRLIVGASSRSLLLNRKEKISV